MTSTIFDVVRCLNLSGGASVALTGGGGKTTFLGILGHALKSLGFPVLLTTTTKVQKPFPIPTDWLVLEPDPDVLKRMILSRWIPGTLGLAVSGPYGPRKWDGLASRVVDELRLALHGGVILNEADGALRRPIKAPAPHEPVIPTSTTHVIPIIGLSVLGAPLDEVHAFRPLIIHEVTGLPLGAPITETAIVTLMTHARGLVKGAPMKAKIFPFLNQADDSMKQAAGRRIAEKILSTSSRIPAVLVGTLRPTARFEIIEP